MANLEKDFSFSRMLLIHNFVTILSIISFSCIVSLCQSQSFKNVSQDKWNLTGISLKNNQIDILPGSQLTTSKEREIKTFFAYFITLPSRFLLQRVITIPPFSPKIFFAYLFPNGFLTILCKYPGKPFGIFVTWFGPLHAEKPAVIPEFCFQLSSSFKPPFPSFLYIHANFANRNLITSTTKCPLIHSGVISIVPFSQEFIHSFSLLSHPQPLKLSSYMEGSSLLSPLPTHSFIQLPILSSLVPLIWSHSCCPFSHTFFTLLPPFSFRPALNHKHPPH